MDQLSHCEKSSVYSGTCYSAVCCKGESWRMLSTQPLGLFLGTHTSLAVVWGFPAAFFLCCISVELLWTFSCVVHDQEVDFFLTWDGYQMNFHLIWARNCIQSFILKILLLSADFTVSHDCCIIICIYRNIFAVKLARALHYDSLQEMGCNIN